MQKNNLQIGKMRAGLMISLVMLTLFVYSCKGKTDRTVQGESFVLADTLPANFLYMPLKGSVIVKSTYNHFDSSIVYQEGKDYTVDYQNGTIKRMASSRIPDYSANPLLGKEHFDEAHFGPYEQWSNNKYFVFVDYNSTDSVSFAVAQDIKSKLPKSIEKLKKGEPLNILWYGNSVSSGGEVSAPELSFTSRFERHLSTVYPKARINSVNISIPGYGTPEAVAWFDDRFRGQKADLVIVGFGLNDQCDIGTAHCSPEQFEQNLRTLARKIQDSIKAEVIFHSEFPPNSRWVHNTHKMNEFAAASRNVAAATNSGYIAVYESWMNVLKRKNEEALLANNINHPNDYGHWIFYSAFAGTIKND